MYRLSIGLVLMLYSCGSNRYDFVAKRVPLEYCECGEFVEILDGRKREVLKAVEELTKAEDSYCEVSFIGEPKLFKCIDSQEYAVLNEDSTGYSVTVVFDESRDSLLYCGIEYPPTY